MRASRGSRITDDGVQSIGRIRGQGAIDDTRESQPLLLLLLLLGEVRIVQNSIFRYLRTGAPSPRARAERRGWTQFIRVNRVSIDILRTGGRTRVDRCKERTGGVASQSQSTKYTIPPTFLIRNALCVPISGGKSERPS